MSFLASSLTPSENFLLSSVFSVKDELASRLMALHRTSSESYRSFG